MKYNEAIRIMHESNKVMNQHFNAYNQALNKTKKIANDLTCNHITGVKNTDDGVVLVELFVRFEMGDRNIWTKITDNSGKLYQEEDFDVIIPYDVDIINLDEIEEPLTINKIRAYLKENKLHE